MKQRGNISVIMVTIVGLLFFAFAAMCFAFSLLMFGRKDVPEGIISAVFVAPMSAALGAVGAFFVNATRSQPPQAVEVVNTPANAVPVDQAP